MKSTRLVLCAGLLFPCAMCVQAETVHSLLSSEFAVTAYQHQTRETEDYKLNFDKSLRQPDVSSHFYSFSLTTGKNGEKQKIRIPAQGGQTIYNDLMDQVVDGVIGEPLTVSCDYSGKALHSYFYIDLNQDGKFSVDLDANQQPTTKSELLSFTYYQGKDSQNHDVAETVSPRNLPVYNLPEDIPAGMYRARIKIDKNNVNASGSNGENGYNLAKEGGFVVDFLLNVRHKTVKLDLQSMNGSLVGPYNGGVKKRVVAGKMIKLLPVPIAAGYEPDKMIVVRHGQNLNGEQYIHGNRQWEEYSIPYTKSIEIPAEKVNGDVRVTLNFNPTDAAEYTLQFCDEFNQADGTLPNDKNWVRCHSWGSTWDRFCAQTPEGQKKTAFIEDGKLVALCLKNPFDDEIGSNGQRRDMISGGVESHGKFDFTYGKIECRLMTNAHTGNFPAFWMMPSKAEHGSWPMDGEIDIFEQIDNENISYHTVHSNWTLNMGQANNPPKGGTSPTITGQYHVYTLEWTEDKLIWYTDGRQAFSYAKSNSQQALNNLQWPFYKDFYLILNQSVGNGSWAKPCDLNYVYRTEFDWVRVYQKGKSANPEAGIEGVTKDTDLDIYSFVGKIHLVAADPVPVLIVDMQGRVVYNQCVQGNVDVALDKGLYIVNGKKVLVK